MVKKLKRILAIVLSFTTLFFKGPICFSMSDKGNDKGDVELVDQGNVSESSDEEIIEEIIKFRIKFEFKKEKYLNNISNTVDVKYKVKDKDGNTVKGGDLKLTKERKTNLSCCGDTDFELKFEKQNKKTNIFNLCDEAVCFSIKPYNNLDVNSLKSVKLILDTESKAKYMFKSADKKSDSDSELSFDFDKDGVFKINLAEKSLSVCLRPLQLIPTKSKNHVEISYAARKINDADLCRSLNNRDHSKVTVPVMNFFLYPPKSVKELFEVKDKASAFFSGNATMHTDVGHRVEGIDCCCSGCNATLKATFLGVVALISSINVITAIYLICRDARAKEIFQACSDGFLGICFLILTGYTLRQLRVTCSKSCCDCYPYKSSDYGCSCGYGCCSDGNSCIGCVNVCNCGEENGCMECCPCDNSGFAIDFCGSYGVGGCCTKPIYEEFITGNAGEVLAGIVDEQYFDELLGKIDKKAIESMCRGLFKSEDKVATGEIDIFRANSLIFYKYMKDGEIVVKFGGAAENVKSLRMLDMLGLWVTKKDNEGQNIKVKVGDKCIYECEFKAGDPNFAGFINEIAYWDGNKMVPRWGNFYEGFMRYVDANPPTAGAERNFGLVIIGNFCRFCDSLHRRYVYLQKRQQN